MLARAGQPGEEPLADLLARELPVAVDRIGRVYGADIVTDLVALGLVEPTPNGYRARARIDRVGDLLIASDLSRHRRASDFVVGPGPASFLLARHVRPHRRGRLLDLGCGSGIQGLLLGSKQTEVVGLDINPRALAYASFNAALNGLCRFRAWLGDFLADEPDRRLDGCFQTVVANPPFVLAPRSELVYRDRPLGRDDVGARTVERVGRALAPDGRGYVLCNWIDDGGADWSRPVRGWVEPQGIDAFVTRVADLTPREYAKVWNRHLPEAGRDGAVQAWTRALEAEGVQRIHIGVIATGRPSDRAGGRPRFIAADGRERPVTWRSVEAFLVVGNRATGPYPGIERSRGATGR